MNYVGYSLLGVVLVLASMAALYACGYRNGRRHEANDAEAREGAVKAVAHRLGWDAARLDARFVHPPEAAGYPKDGEFWRGLAAKERAIQAMAYKSPYSVATTRGT